MFVIAAAFARRTVAQHNTVVYAVPALASARAATVFLVFPTFHAASRYDYGATVVGVVAVFSAPLPCPYSNNTPNTLTVPMGNGFRLELGLSLLTLLA